MGIRVNSGLPMALGLVGALVTAGAVSQRVRTRGPVSRIRVGHRDEARPVPMTRRSTAAGEHLRVVQAFDAGRVEHVLAVPKGACPVSGNPLSGTLSLTYAPKSGPSGGVLEAVSLYDTLNWACSGVPGAPRSVEELARFMARAASAALDVPVEARLDLVIRPGSQRLIVRSP